MLSLNGEPLTNLHSLSSYHRDQAEALITGHLALSESIYDLRPSLAWFDGKTQQVWGLGIGLLLLPFQLFWRVMGFGLFPDRVVLGLAFTVLCYCTLTSGLVIARQEGKGKFLGVTLLILLFPPMWTLSRSSYLIFEETILYATIFSLLILVSLLRLCAIATEKNYLLCCFLGVFSVWLRPTHFAYGLAAIFVATSVFWQQKKNLRGVVMALCLLTISLTLLAWSNYVRFGSPMEFGHRLTVSTPSMVFLTRFGNPFAEASFTEQLKELFGLLFCSVPSNKSAFDDLIFSGQSEVTRWRKLDFSTFDLSYFCLMVVGVVAAIIYLCKSARNERPCGFNEKALSIGVMLVWSGVSILALILFYRHYPTITSRYLMDFIPGFVGILVIGWILAVDCLKRSGLILLSGWLLAENVLSGVVPQTYLTVAKIEKRVLGAESAMSLQEFNGHYSLKQHPRLTSIACNGYGWDQRSGVARNIVTLAVDSPKRIELIVTKRRSLFGELANNDSYRAQIGGHELLLREVQQEENDRMVVIFEVPKAIQTRQRDEILFLSFTESYSEADRDSMRVLVKVKWR